jgi:hypothetical protein
MPREGSTRGSVADGKRPAMAAAAMDGCLRKFLRAPVALLRRRAGAAPRAYRLRVVHVSALPGRLARGRLRLDHALPSGLAPRGRDPRADAALAPGTVDPYPHGRVTGTHPALTPARARLARPGIRHPTSHTSTVHEFDIRRRTCPSFPLTSQHERDGPRDCPSDRTAGNPPVEQHRKGRTSSRTLSGPEQVVVDGLSRGAR